MAGNPLNRNPWIAPLILLTALLITSAVSSLAAAGGAPPTQRANTGWGLGQNAPSPDSLIWIRPAGGEKAHTAPLTILTFWATWDPTGRIIVGRQDSLAARYAGRVRVVAISIDSPALTRRFLGDGKSGAGPSPDKAGKPSPASGKWPHSEIACDPHGDLFERVHKSIADDAFFSIPLTVIVGEDGMVLWSGFPVDAKAARPTATFDAVLEQILNKSYSLDRALADAAPYEAARRLLRGLRKSWEAGDLARADSILSAMGTTRFPEAPRADALTLLNQIAWGLATRDGRTANDLDLALKASQVGWDYGGDQTAEFADTRARVLFESGQISEAVVIQEKAVDLAKNSKNGYDYGKALADYRKALGLPPAGESEAAAAAGQPQEAIDRVPWSGVINEAYSRFDKGRYLYRISPPKVGDSREDSLWYHEMAVLANRFGGTVHKPDDVPEKERSGKVLVLYGTPGSNPLVREVLDAYQIQLGPDGVRFGDRLVPTPNPVLITCVPSPWDPPYPVVVYTAYRVEDAHGLNRLFHGPTQGVIGRRNAGGKLEAVASFNYIDISLKHAVPDIPSPELSAADGVEDLRALTDMLETGYAGFDDLDARLRASGSSWTKRVASFKARITARNRWQWADLVALLQEFLDPIQDTHFSIQAEGPTKDGGFSSVRARFIRGYSPFYTDLRIGRTPEGLRVVSAPDTLASMIGAEPVGVGVIGDPYEVKPGTAYLFPTLPDPTGGERYLLGILSVESDAPKEVRVDFGPGKHDRRLPVHRGRMRESVLYSGAGAKDTTDCTTRTNPGTGWNLCLPPKTPVPWLANRTMVEQNLNGFAASADTLRTVPDFVLDLRGNGGGGDSPALDWISRLSAQEVRMMGSVQRTSQEADPLKSISSRPFGIRAPGAGGASARPASTIYQGRVAVLVDRGVASSGETMTQIAGQIPKAVLIGENTAGCVSYGNVEEHGPLPHSRIKLSFGRSHFVMDVIRSNPEGMGFFPDYWLDQADPTTAVSAWLTGSGR
jgi:hypothetical protein